MAARPRRRGQRHRRELLLVIRRHARNWPVIQLHIAQGLIERIEDDGGGRVRTWSVTASTPAKLRAAISGTMSMRYRGAPRSLAGARVRYRTRTAPPPLPTSSPVCWQRQQINATMARVVMQVNHPAVESCNFTKLRQAPGGKECLVRCDGSAAGRSAAAADW